MEMVTAKVSGTLISLVIKTTLWKSEVIKKV